MPAVVFPSHYSPDDLQSDRYEFELQPSVIPDDKIQRRVGGNYRVDRLVGPSAEANAIEIYHLLRSAVPAILELDPTDRIIVLDADLRARTLLIERDMPSRHTYRRMLVGVDAEKPWAHTVDPLSAQTAMARTSAYGCGVRAAMQSEIRGLHPGALGLSTVRGVVVFTPYGQIEVSGAAIGLNKVTLGGRVVTAEEWRKSPGPRGKLFARDPIFDGAPVGKGWHSVLSPFVEGNGLDVSRSLPSAQRPFTEVDNDRTEEVSAEPTQETPRRVRSGMKMLRSPVSTRRSLYAVSEMEIRPRSEPSIRLR